MDRTAYLDGAGTLERTSDGYRVQFTRTYQKPLEQLWEAISSPEGLDSWYPTTLRTDGVVGNQVTETFEGENAVSEAAPPGTLTAYEPPNLFEYRIEGPDEAPYAGMLGDQTIRMEARPDGKGSKLTFTHEVETLPTALDVLSGWHYCLEFLAIRMGAQREQPTREKLEGFKRYYEGEYGG